MSIFSKNMRYLRGKLNLSQQKVADDLLITRGRYGKYEDDAAEPPLEILIKISKYYNISIDLLLTINVSKFSIDEMIELPDNRSINTKEYEPDEFEEHHIQNFITQIKTDIKQIKETIRDKN